MLYSIENNITTEQLINSLPSYEEALSPYYGNTIVIKMGGSLMDNQDAIQALAVDVLVLKRCGITPIIVNGGGKAIDRALNNDHPLKIAGYRVTDESTAITINDVLFNVSKNIVNEIANYYDSVFLTTAEAIQGCQVFNCKPREVFLDNGTLADLKFVGKITGVNLASLFRILDDDKIPIVGSTALGENNKIYNCNADDAAANMAIACKADNLIFLTEANGIYDKNGETCHNLSEDEVLDMINKGELASQILPKLEGVLEALEKDVPNVSVIDGRTNHSVLLELLNYDSPSYLGTRFYK